MNSQDKFIRTKQIFGERLCKLREERGLSRVEFMSKLRGYTVSSDSAYKITNSWEKGTHLPDVQVLSDICEILECDADYLLGTIDTKRHKVQNLTDLTGLPESFAEKLISDWENVVDPFEETNEGIVFNLKQTKVSYLPLLEKIYDDSILMSAIMSYIKADHIHKINHNGEDIELEYGDILKIEGFPVSTEIVRNGYLNIIRDRLNHISSSGLNTLNNTR